MSPTPTPATPPMDASRAWDLLRGAIASKSSSSLAAALSLGCDPNARDPDSGETALHLACRVGSPTEVASLLSVGADPAALCRGLLNSALYSPGRFRGPACAALDGLFRSRRTAQDERECAANMSALIGAGLAPERPTQGSRSVWSDLLDWPQAPLSVLLPWIRAGAPINQTDRKGQTLLYKAVNASRSEDAWLLFELGADPFIRQPGAQNASCAASARGLTELYAAFGGLARARFQRAALDASVGSARAQDRARRAPGL